jgi:hypothetical protein
MPTKEISQPSAPLTDRFIQPNQNNSLIYYLGDVFDWHGYIKFLSLAALRESSADVPLEKLFVEPRVSKEHLLPDAFEVMQPPTMPLSLALAENRLLVLLGDPGSGKSTVVNWICTALSRGIEGQLVRELGGPLIPLPIVLRELGIGHEFVALRNPEKQWNHFLELFLARPVSEQLNADRRIHGILDKSLLGQMLHSGQALFLLDGIDELGSVEILEALRGAVNEGIRRYPRCRWITTSRIVGYEEVPFDRGPGYLSLPEVVPSADSLARGMPEREQKFERLYLAPFNDAQVEKSTKLWWLQHESNPHLAGTHPSRFLEALRQNKGVRSLARIPNLLTMVALIYRVRAELPDGRAVLYSLIADAYLGTLDKQRGLERLRPIPYGVEGAPQRTSSSTRTGAIRVSSFIVSGVLRRTVLSRARFDPDWLELDAENDKYGTRLKDLWRYAGEVVWRETLIFLWESASLTSPVLPQRLFERLFSWNRDVSLWDFPNSVFAEIEPENHATLQRVLLAADISVKPHITLKDSARRALKEVCWKWELRRQDLAYKNGDWSFLFQANIAPTLLSRPGSTAESFEVLDHVANLEQAQTLSLSCPALTDLRLLPNIPSLRAFYLFSNSVIDDLNPLSRLSRLGELMIIGFGALSDLSPLVRLTELVDLSLIALPRLRDLSSLRKLNSLTDLGLRDNSALSDISAIAELTGLKSLRLKGCPAVSANEIDTFRKLRPGVRIVLD